METNKQTDKTEESLTFAPPGTKVQTLLKQEIIQDKDLDMLSKEEKQQLSRLLTISVNELKGEERDKFLEKIDAITSNDSRKDLWECNQANISSAITSLMDKNGRMPTKAEIAVETGLSRKTIHKHLKEYKEHPLFAEQEEQFRFLKGRLQTMLYQMAAKGDIKAIKLFLEATGLLDNNKTVNKNIIENQHNYIQINETRLSQDEIKKLSPERLKQIEALLKMP